ncbi:Reverse transcriptase [Theobroma cacao]|nr:Reverse transcriptase [Theobroma cacao]
MSTLSNLKVLKRKEVRTKFASNLKVLKRKEVRTKFTGLLKHYVVLSRHQGPVLNRSINEPTLYVLSSNGFVNLLVSLYVDDLPVIGPDSYVVDNFKMKMKQEFEMTNLGEMTFFLGMEFVQKPNYICIHQTKYARELL